MDAFVDWQPISILLYFFFFSIRFCACGAVDVVCFFDVAASGDRLDTNQRTE
jgi:hypothetical protein